MFVSHVLRRWNARCVEGDALLVATELVTDAVTATGVIAQHAGWSDTELAELFAHVAANLFTNYFNHYAGTALDLPHAPDAS